MKSGKLYEKFFGSLMRGLARSLADMRLRPGRWARYELTLPSGSHNITVHFIGTILTSSSPKSMAINLGSPLFFRIRAKVRTGCCVC